jgi:AAA family ATP:ADP antiporter
MADEQNQKKSGILSILGDVYPGEGMPVFLMLLNLAIILISYYIIKVVREPLILSTPGGAAWKSYSAAGQAVVLMAYVPLYSWFSSQVNRTKLVLGISLFFLVCIELFSIGVRANVPYIGIAFFIWVGIFSLSIIAQFWSLANDLYREDQGKRLFPIIAIGATLGSPIGSKLASILFDKGLPPQQILHISAALLAVSMLLYWIVQRKQPTAVQTTKSVEEEKLGKAGGFQLLFRSRYLLLIAALLFLLNIVNTNGEFILSSKVVEAAKQVAGTDTKKFIGSFYGNFFFLVNIIAFVMQAFVVSRIVKYFGIAGVVLFYPFLAIGAYSVVAAGATLAIVRWTKTAENATDYSVMNTARAMLWLPTSREEKYKAKQAVDTFVVRIADMVSAGVVFAGLNWLALQTRGFALVNVIVCAIWICVAFVLIKEYRKLSATEQKVAA